MFVLAEMKDTVRIPPFLFHMDIRDAITERLNKKFANRVIHNLGLCIALWDLTKLEESYVFPGDAASHTIVHFRYIVFRPFIDEILVGTVKSCSKEGVHVSLTFFDDILIPPDCLQTGSYYSTDEQDPTWIWDYAAENGEAGKLFIEPGEKIRFRVVEEVFTDTSPTGPDVDKQFESLELEQKKASYSLLGSINETGLGMVLWWAASNPE